MIQIHPLIKRNFPALLGFVMAFAVGLRVVAAEEQCATTQPQLRELFPIEMRILKFFEGSLKGDKKVITINADKKKIQFQMSGPNAEGEEIVSAVETVKVCKVNETMVIKLAKYSFPMEVLAKHKMRIKLGDNWHDFTRVLEVVNSFRAPTGTAATTPPAPAAAATEPAAAQPGVE